MKIPDKLKKLRKLVVAVQLADLEAHPRRVMNLTKSVLRELGTLKTWGRKLRGEARLAEKAARKPRASQHCQACGKFDGQGKAHE